MEKPISVYNFEVEDFHTYYVGNSEVLVLNKYIKDAKEFIKSPKNAKEVLKYLEKQGFEEVHTKGSHVRLKKGNLSVTVPKHGSKDLKIKTLKSIME